MIFHLTTIQIGQMSFNILLSGEYDLTIILFLIMQLIANKKLEENSKEVKLIISIFKFMINTKYKSN